MKTWEGGLLFGRALIIFLIAAHILMILSCVTLHVKNQLNLSSSYIQEHLEDNSKIVVNQETNPLIYIAESSRIISNMFPMDRVKLIGNFRMASRGQVARIIVPRRIHLVVPWICKAQTR